MARQLVTGDAIFGGRYGLLLVFNRSQLAWLNGAFLALLEFASHPENWRTGGETTPEEAAEYFSNLFEGITAVPFLIGMIVDFPVALTPGTGFIPCDGQLLYRDDYADLFAVIGTTFSSGGDPGDQFRVPDLRGRVRAGSDDSAGRITTVWANDVGGAGGEETHTLDVSETPAHSHTDTGHFHTEGNATLSAAEAPIAPIPSAVPGLGITGSGSANLTNTGGGGAHNNLQPTMIFYPHIFARF